MKRNPLLDMYHLNPMPSFANALYGAPKWAEEEKHSILYRPKQTGLEVLNNLPGYNYKLPTKEQLKNAIHKKYGFAPYPPHSSVEAMKISSYSKEIFEMSMNLQKKMDLVVANNASLKILNKEDAWGIMTFKAKLWKQPNIMDKANKFREHLKTFEDKLWEYTGMMSKCIEMVEADKIANELFKFHDSNIGNLEVESQLALEQFKIDAAGVIPDGGH